MYDLRIEEGGRDPDHFSPKRCIGTKKVIYIREADI
jgi:hypothetical protein